MPEVRNLWALLALMVLAVGLYALNTEVKEYRVATAMRQRQAITAKWLKESDYLRELEKISVDYCPTEFRNAWNQYLQIVRFDVSPEGQQKKTLALANGQTMNADPVFESGKTLDWIASGYGFEAKNN